MQPCSVLLPPSYSRPSCILLSTSPFPDPYQGRPLPLWPCGIHWTASLAMLLVHLLMSVSEPNALYMYMLYVVLPQTATVTSLLARHIQHFKPKSQVEAVQGCNTYLRCTGKQRPTGTESSGSRHIVAHHRSTLRTSPVSRRANPARKCTFYVHTSTSRQRTHSTICKTVHCQFLQVADGAFSTTIRDPF